MSVLALFLLLALPPPGSWGQAAENKEPLQSAPDLDDDYEAYETPMPELLGGDNGTTPQPAVVAEATQPEATGTPGATDVVGLPTTSPAETPGTQAAAEETTTDAATAGTTEGTTEGQRTTRDLPTERGTTEAALSEVPSQGQPGSVGPSPGAAATDAAQLTTADTAATTPLGTTPALSLDTDEPETTTLSGNQPLPDSAATGEPPAPSSATSSPPSTAPPTHQPSTPSAPSPSSSFPRAQTEVATRQSGLSNATALVVVATSASSFLSGHIPVRQCLLAVLILALVATIFLICTVVLAMRLSRKGHTYPVRDYSPTEMVCISSLLAEGEGPPTANGGPPGAKTQLLKPAPGLGEDCDGDDLTLHSFLP